MKKTPCTIYDCEFDEYQDGILIGDMVYALDKEGKPVAASRYVCEHVDFEMVQFYTGYYDETWIEPEKDTSKWGYFLLSTGEVIVSPIYDCASPFYGDRARVQKNMKYGFIDPEGREVVEVIWDDTAGAFHKALCWVKKGDKFGYIDKNGTIVLPPQFDVAGEFQYTAKFNVDKDEDGYFIALIKKDGKYGYIDRKGHYILEPCLDDAKTFWEVGYAPVMRDGKWGFVDRNGKIIVDFQFDEIGKSDGYISEKVVNKEKILFGRPVEFIDFYTVKKDRQWGVMIDNFDIIMPKAGQRYVVYRDMKIYIKDGKVTSMRKVKSVND